MRGILLLFLVLPRAAASAAAPPYLEADTVPAKRYPERARPTRAAALSFAPGGTQVSEAPADDELTVVETEGGNIRIVLENTLVRVAVYVDLAALPVVARQGAVVVSTKEATHDRVAPSTPGVRLRAGTPVAATADGARYETDVNGGQLVVTGFLRDGTFGRSFVPEPPPRAAAATIGVTRPLRLLDMPGGRVLATWQGDSAVAARRLATRGDHILVRIDQAPAVLIGWVEASAATARVGMRGRVAVTPRIGIPGRLKWVGPPDGVQIVRGTLLHAAPDGPPVAVALATATFAAEPTSPFGWTAVKIRSPVGDHVFFVPKEIPAYLDPDTDIEKRYRERTVPTVEAALSLTAGGPTVHKALAEQVLVVVEEVGDVVRVVEETVTARLVFHVDPKALPIVARNGSVIVASRAAAARPAGPRTPGVRLDSGTPIEVTATGRVAYGKDGVSVTGFLPDGAYGRAFIPDPEPRPAPNEDALVKRPIRVLDAPGGATLATFEGEGELEVERLGPKRGGHLLVRFDEEPVVAIGWVEARAVTVLGPHGRGYNRAYGGGKGKKRGRPVTKGHRAARGAVLFATPDGPAVGVILADSIFALRPGAKGKWIAIEVPSPYGDVDVFVSK